MVKRSLDISSSRQRERKRPKQSAALNDEDDEHRVDQQPGELTAGIIKRIELRNFMNHAHLDFSFAPQVNFVTGRNGTGKSALLTGLIVGLGGKASATNRGSQLGGFIQDGKTVCEIKISLNNRGEEAYLPDIFGETIVVERKLVRGGTADYKIKTERGKIISTKKQDLNKILEHLNIQVENPVAILNQETSKNFLASKNPADVYKLYIKATMIEQMAANYQSAQQMERDSTALFKSKESALPRLKSELKQAQDRAAALDGLDHLEKKINQKKIEMAWAVVREREIELEEMQEELATKSRGRKKYENKLTKSEESLASSKAGKAGIEEQIRKMGDESTKLQPQAQKAKSTLIDKKAAVRKDQSTLASLGNDLRRHQSDRQAMLDRIQEIEEEAKKDKGDQIAENEQKIAEKEQQDSEIMAEITELKTNATKARHAESSLRDQKLEHASNMAEDEQVKRRHQKTIDEMKKSRSDAVAKFGKFWPRLKAEIDKATAAGRFHKKPYGPLGAHVKVTDMKYALACEVALGGMLTAAYVHDKHDFDLMNRIKQQVCGGETGPVVLKSTFTDTPHDISRDRPHTDYPLLIDVLDINAVPVWNALIDKMNLQHILLIHNGDEARQYMRTQCPRNCASAYDGRGRQILPKPFRVYNTKIDTVRFLSTNIEEDMKKEAQKLRDVSETLRIAEVKLRDLNQKISNASSEARKLGPLINGLNKRHTQIQMEIQQLKEAAAEVAAPPDAAGLQNDVDELTTEIVNLKENHRLAVEKKVESKAACEQAEREYAEASARLQDIQAQTDPIRADLEEVDDKIERAKISVDHYKNELKKFDEKYKASETKVKEKEAAVQKDIAEATLQHERVQTRKTPASIEGEMKKIQNQLNREEQLRGNADEIRQKLEEVTEMYTRTQTEVKSCKEFTRVMKSSLKLRFENMSNIIQSTETRSQVYFCTMLHERNYTGKLIFDREQKKLNITVRPSASKDTKGSQDLKGLSGGEKSFSTLCFMLSLWEATESPFRCMDEFDVFMDMVNRKVSMKMITSFASDHKQNQFIMLTPQDTSQLAQSDSVHIFRMPDTLRTGRRTGEDDE